MLSIFSGRVEKVKKNKNKQTIIKDYRVWNRIRNKPAIANAIAVEGDVVMKINNVWFLCQRGGDVNNIVCFLQKGKWVPGLNSVRAMFDFCFRLRAIYGIEYIRVSGREGRYDFIDRLFSGDSVKANNGELNEYGEIVRYVHLNDRVMAKLAVLRRARKDGEK